MAFLERCLVISSTFPLTLKMRSQAAETAQEFEPTTHKKKATSSKENVMQTECN